MFLRHILCSVLCFQVYDFFFLLFPPTSSALHCFLSFFPLLFIFLVFACLHLLISLVSLYCAWYIFKDKLIQVTSALYPCGFSYSKLLM